MKSSNGSCRCRLTLAIIAGCGLACSGGAFAAVGHGVASPHMLAQVALQPTRIAAPVRAVGSGSFVTLSQATPLGQADRVTAVAPLTAQFHIVVALKLRNPAQLHAFISRPHAPMSRATLAASYYPATTQVDAVTQYLRRAGFRDIQVSQDHMLVNAIGSSMAVRQAFGTTMVQVATADGRTAFANSTPIKLPANLKDSVVAVLGLQNVHVAHTMAHPAAVPSEGIGHDPVDFASIYGAASLPAATDINVGIWGWGSMAQAITDLGDFTTDNSLPAVNTQTVCLNVGGTADPNTGVVSGGTTIAGDDTCGGIPNVFGVEWNIDSQDIIGMSGGVKTLTFYGALVAYDSGLTNALEEIITPTVGEPQPQVVDASFGLCERFADINQGGDGAMQADDQLFQTAIAAGMTFSVSTGDDGYDECGAYNQQYFNNAPAANSASYPASSPYVVAVSGTTLRTVTGAPTWARENVWFNSGGSPSSAEVAQTWQAPLTYGQYAGQRGPDVAFVGNPGTGAILNVNGGYQQWGGTSLAAPVFAGAWARILEADSSANLGFAGPHLYALPASDFHDITAGNNRGDDTSGGYIAQRGWDWATGLGSFDVGQVAADLATQ